METIKAFLNDYGYSFLMMVVIGAVVALILELTVKKALDWLEKKLEGHDRALAMLASARIFLIQCVTWVLVAIFTKILVDNMPLPAGAVFYPVWLLLVYIIQYVFSMYGLKGLLKLLKERSEREPKEKEPKQPKPKKVNPVEGFTRIGHNCYKDPATGNFYNKKGEQL